MKYFNLSVFTMIITGFVMKVVRLVRGKKRPGLVPNGLTPEEWDHAMSQAKICRSRELVLQIGNDSGSGTVRFDWIVGPSLGDAADVTFMYWCRCNLEHLNGFYLIGIDTRPTPRGAHAMNPQWPLSIKNWADMMNVYNVLMHQAELRERKSKGPR